MKQFRKYCIGMLLLVTLLFVTACSYSKNDAVTDNPGTNNGTDGAADGAGDNDGIAIDDILFDTDGDGVYDHTDVDGDGLLEQIGADANDVVDDLMNDAAGGDDTLVNGNPNKGSVSGEGTVGNGNGTTTP